jgi:hypothetical protein
MILPPLLEFWLVRESLEVDFLILLEILIHLKQNDLECTSTYHALCDSWRETHLISRRFHLIEKVSASLKETKHSVEEAVNTLACLLSNGEKQIVVSLVYATHFKSL